MTDTGRWNRMKSPSTRRGSRAACLSSGGRTTPRRCTEVKSRVVANATAGPCGPNAVYAITQQSSSSTRVIRGSSTPQASCG